MGLDRLPETMGQMRLALIAPFGRELLEDKMETPSQPNPMPQPDPAPPVPTPIDPPDPA